MANVKISDLPSATSVGTSDVFPFTQSGVTKKATSSLFTPFLNVQAYGATGNGSTDDTAAIQSAVTAAGVLGNWLYIPPGTYKTTSTIDLPQSLRMTGPTRTGITSKGANFDCRFAGPCFRRTVGSATVADIALENFSVTGHQGTYGAGNGLTFINSFDITLNRIVVSDFGTNNISCTGGWALYMHDCYTATAGNANYYIDQADTVFDNCNSDGGTATPYDIYVTVNGVNTQINGGFIEGAGTDVIYIAAQQCSVNGVKINPTTATSTGLRLAATAYNATINGNRFTYATNNNGIVVTAGCYGYAISGNSVLSGAIAISLSEGNGTCIGNNVSGDTTGLKVTGGTYPHVVTGNVIAGGTNSIEHVSGTKTVYIGNYLHDGAGNYKAMTVTAGTPIVIDPLATGTALYGLGVSGLLKSAASSATIAGVNLPHGTAPGTPTNGDMWTTTAGLFVRINGVTVGPLT
jgi:hypothetical protein